MLGCAGSPLLGSLVSGTGTVNDSQAQGGWAGVPRALGVLERAEPQQLDRASTSSTLF